MKVNMYILSHKPYKIPLKKSSIYKDLLLGADLGNKGNENSLLDNSGVNISSKNKSFCELTGIYWIWKNSNADVVGIDHYRRFFVETNTSKELLTKKSILNALENNDIILPKRNKNVFTGKTAAQFFGNEHDPLVWTLCRDWIKKNTPDYLDDFDWFSREKDGYVFNMFIGKKELLNNYFEWLFLLLFSLEKEIDLSIYDKYNQRMYGFLAERLLNVWVHHNRLKVKEFPVYFTEKPNFREKLKGKLISLNNWILRL
ncbi:DUF4422 domain-containing protein [Lactobacillus helveticus]|uniref:DUF4422 domain-containing protein n=1 Tax=Lactobacillus helveticus TaxID=1587 RepID=UPI00197CAEA6|nr:DUF4422 domain-containing protein [Lactobacillus helveticus]MBN6049690.1 DUF4422 domain-containing protein [Lactobacillus helveticus]